MSATCKGGSLQTSCLDLKIIFKSKHDVSLLFNLPFNVVISEPQSMLHVAMLIGQMNQENCMVT